MEHWSPQRPMERRRSFRYMFKRFIRDYIRINVKKIPNNMIIAMLMENIPDDIEISKSEWDSICRRFKTQYKKWQTQTIGSAAATSDGWLRDFELLNRRVSADFGNPRSQWFEGVISDVTDAKIPGLATIAAKYRVTFDDHSQHEYHIFKVNNKFIRVNGRTGKKQQMRFLAVPITQKEPDPCEDPHQKLCLACNVACVDTILLPCGHACMCVQCAKRQFNRNGTCPICRNPIQRVQKMFYDGVDNNKEIDKLKAEIDKLKAK